MEALKHLNNVETLNLKVIFCWSLAPVFAIFVAPGWEPRLNKRPACVHAYFFFPSNPIFIKTFKTCASLFTILGCGLQRFLSVVAFLWSASHTDVPSLGGGKHARRVSQRCFFYYLLSRKNVCVCRRWNLATLWRLCRMRPSTWPNSSSLGSGKYSTQTAALAFSTCYMRAC